MADISEATLGPVRCQGCGAFVIYGGSCLCKRSKPLHGSLRWLDEATFTVHRCDNGAGGVSTKPNRLTAATAADPLTPGHGRRVASRE